MIGVTEIGSIREENQDAILVSGLLGCSASACIPLQPVGDYPSLAAVTDGMGGFLGGRQAAGELSLKLASIDHLLDDKEWLEWCNEVNKEMLAIGKAIGFPQMGAAFAALHFAEEGVYAINVGDCRSYRLVSGYFAQMSCDDSTTVNGSKVLIQAIGGTPSSLVVHYRYFPYMAETERFLICSDGLYNVLTEERLKENISADVALRIIAEGIVEETYSNLPQDNFSFVLGEVKL